MSDVIECACGKRLRVPAGGKRVRCPACQAVVTVPEEDEPVVAEVDDGTVGVVKELTCPGCRRRWPENTAICIECGHDFRSGKKLKQRLAEQEVVVHMGGLFVRSRFTIRRDVRGRKWLIRKKWVFWIGLKPLEILLDEYTAVVTDHRQSGNDENASHMFYLSLQGRKSQVPIWSGTNDEKMRELVDALRATAGLSVKRG